MVAWAVALLPVLGELLKKILPDTAQRQEAEAKLKELVVMGELEYLKADVQLALGQMEINKADAQGQSALQRTWRPTAAWLCVVGGLAYPLTRALVPWGLQVVGVDGVPPLPALDSTESLAMLSGLLGLGGMRAMERIKGKV